MLSFTQYFLYHSKWKINNRGTSTEIRNIRNGKEVSQTSVICHPSLTLSELYHVRSIMKLVLALFTNTDKRLANRRSSPQHHSTMAHKKNGCEQTGNMLPSLQVTEPSQKTKLGVKFGFVLRKWRKSNYVSLIVMSLGKLSEIPGKMIPEWLLSNFVKNSLHGATSQSGLSIKTPN